VESALAACCLLLALLLALPAGTAAAAGPSRTPTPAPTLTFTPTPSPRPTLTPTPTRTAAPSPTSPPSLVPTPAPTPLPTSPALTAAHEHRFGTSAEGRPLLAYLLGHGSQDVLIVGDIHGAPEVNTAALVWSMLETFEREPALLPAQLSLVVVPEANPDGLADGTRELADGVDPNRNWPTADWSPDSFGPDGYLPDGGGPAPLSEPETQALAALVTGLRPVAVLSYHSAAGLVMGGPAARAGGLFDAYVEASGYLGGYWTAYPVGGDFAQWCDDDLSIPTVEVELSDHLHPELDRNLAGTLAVVQAVARNPPY